MPPRRPVVFSDAADLAVGTGFASKMNVGRVARLSRASRRSGGVLLLFSWLLLAGPERLFGSARERLFLQPGVRQRVKDTARRRNALAGLLSGTVVATEGPAHGAVSGPPVDMYFGQGSFWQVQSDCTSLESQLLGRAGTAITSISGYAGGQPVNNQLVCYHNLEYPRRDYAILGHAEAVQVAGVPPDKVVDFARSFLDSVPVPVNESDSDRRGEEGESEDGVRRGPEYRAMLGLPGGSESPYFKDILEASGGRLKLAVGKGGDPSTAGTDVVWIYDSSKFPFYQAELYHQFHEPDSSKKSALKGEKYKGLREALLRRGRLQPVSCPESEIEASSGAVDEVEDSLNFGGSGDDPFEPVLGFLGKPNAPTPPSMKRVQKDFVK